VAPLSVVINVASGVDLEPYFTQMPVGVSCALRLARGGTWSGDYLYRSSGGGVLSATHFIEAQPGSGPLPVLQGGFQIGVDNTPITNLTVRDLRFTGEGPKALGNGKNLTLRRLELAGCSQGIVVQAGEGLTWKDVIVARNRILDLDTGSSEHGNGIYCARVAGLKVIDNVVDHAVAPLDIFSHHIYIQNGVTGLIVRRNILTRSSSHAIQARPGGNVDHNLVLDCPVGILIGGGTDPEDDGVTFDAHHNVVLGGGNIDPTGDNLPRGWAYYLENVASGTMRENIAADGVGGDKRGLTLDGSLSVLDNDEVGVNNVSGTNYHRAHGTVHTDPGSLLDNTVTLGLAPNPSGDLSYASLGLTWEAIRAGSVDVLSTLVRIRSRLGLR
jgi:hypothetical protein